MPDNILAALRSGNIIQVHWHIAVASIGGRGEMAQIRIDQNPFIT